MCGICGFYSHSKLFSIEPLRTMTNCLTHRGPDADGLFYNEIAGLGHRRLSIIDLSKQANQPMVSHNNRYVMVYNGEVYNYKEIEKEIRILNSDFKLNTNSDTEIIIEAFSLWGTDFVNKLNGMFVIVIYDKTEDSLYIFRDRLGIKPLYYFWDGQNFVFASELKALKQVEFIRNNLALNPHAINEYLHLGYIPEPHSIYNIISKFPSGSYASLKANKLDLREYWQLEDKIKPEVLIDEHLATEQLKELLIRSVKYRMLCDVPFGTFLSGGIDSSLVTAIAQSLSHEPVKTFNIRFTESKYDESNYAKAIAKHLGTKHHEYTVTEKDAIELIPHLLDIYDEPYADSSAIPTLLVSKMAKQVVTMTLSGDGGDELFWGYGAYKWAKRLNNPLVNILKHPSKILLSNMNNRYRRASMLFDYKKNNETLCSHIFSQEQYLFNRTEIQSLINPDLYREIILNETPCNINRFLKPEEQQSLFDINYYLKDDLLVKVDRASMYYSLETRVPLLDYRIVEYAFNLSPGLKYKNNISKYILKKILYDYIPPEYFSRPKWGFSIPLQKWLQNDLSYLINYFLSEEKINAYGIFNYSVINKLKTDFFQKNRTYLYNRLWQAIILQNFIEKNNHFNEF